MGKRIVSAWLPVVGMCVIIFLFSQDAHSGRHSMEVLGWVLWLLHADTPRNVYLWNEPFRKFAHVVVYFLLSLTAYRGFAMGQLRFRWGAAVRTIIFCALYAASDEYHQSFIKGRGPSARDVGIDSGAAVVALVLIWLWLRCDRGRTQVAELATGERAAH
ncbi:MAG: VanZ family protein [Terriglobales bacterium]